MLVIQGPGALLFAAILALSALMVSASPSSPVDLHVEHIGVPFPSWTSPVYSNATSFNLNPQLTRYSHLAPRFHRLLRYNLDVNSKSQTAIFVAGRSADDEEQGKQGASVLSALNPRNGGIVWRIVRNDTDRLHSMHLASDVLFTISGLGQAKGAMHHALSGQLLWTVDMVAGPNSQHTGLFDAALLPPMFEISSTATVVAAAPDVVAMDRSGRVFRFAGFNGAPVWLNDIVQPSIEVSAIPIKLHSTQSHTIVISLIPHSPKIKLLSSTETYSLSVTVFSAVDGARLTSYEVPNSKVEMDSVTSEHNTAGNVVVLGKDATGTSKLRPQLVWLQTDGTIRSLLLPLPQEQKEVQLEASSINVIKSKTASRYTGLWELPSLSSRGVIIALTDEDKSEALKIKTAKQELTSFWLFEEDAKDAIYQGTIDRKDQAYISRMYFVRSQQLLNLHVLWVDAHAGEGQVTGFSFQWDHDLNGDVLAGPFEASQVSEFQLITRAVLVTASSSIRMIQEDKHQWIREEGLSHTTASVLIDLLESRVGTEEHSSGLDAKMLLQGENYLHRLERHMIDLQHAPQYTIDAMWKALKEIPAMSLDSFGIHGIGRKPGTSESDKASAKATTTAVKTYGAGPVGKVGAQKVQYAGSRHPPKGVPPVSTRKVKGPTQDDKPPPPVALAPRLANATVAASLKGDAFGFRKLIVATSKKGKIYAIDSQSGDNLWEKSLIGFGEGEGTDVPKVNVRLLALVRSVGGSSMDMASAMQQSESDEASNAEAVQLEQSALVVVVAEIEEKGVVVTRMWQIDPLTGQFEGGIETQTGLVLFPGKAKDAFLLPVEDKTTGQIAVAIVDPKDKVLITPTSPSVVDRFASISHSFFYTTQETVKARDGTEKTVLVGYKTVLHEGSVQGERVWQLPITLGEEVVSVTRPSQDVVASQGKVLGDRQTLYKYLNSHSLVVATRREEDKSARVFIIDGINGRILHEATLCQGNLALTQEDGTQSKIHVTFTENWASVVFDVDVPAGDALAKYKGAHRQTRILSMELYEVQHRESETWKWKGTTSSLGRKAGAVYSNIIQVFSQVYVLPSEIRGVATTRTKYGISSKAILVANNRGRILALPRRLLDPRRPVGRKPNKDEIEEGLGTYDPYIPESSRWYVGGDKIVPQMSKMKTRASSLESLSVVFVYGSLDWWVTKTAPSGTFDLLSDSFNKPQLLLTIVVLSVGLIVAKPMVASKTLRARW